MKMIPTQKGLRRLPAAIALTSLALTGCTSPVTPSLAPGTPSSTRMVATTTQLGSILGDIAQCAGGTSTTLMGPGDDPHEFAMSSSQVADLVRATLVVASGLGLEAGITSALSSAARDGAQLYEVAPDLEPLTFATLEERLGIHDDAEGSDEHSPDELDPHVHLDKARMATAAEKIGERAASATGDTTWAGCASQVAGELRTVDAEIRDTLAAIPEESRVLVTDHEAYNYFADAYGFRIAGVVIPGGGTDAEPSSAVLADLVEVIRKDGVRVLFSNNTVSPALVEALALEAGGEVKVVQLYEGSVGAPGTPAETSADMMRENARLITEALA